MSNYVVANIRPWHVETFENRIRYLPGNWLMVSEVSELTFEKLEKINPRYIFFPHWSAHVPNEILMAFECVGFHETDLPFGRGGSPIQNLIAHGHTNTMISAIRMTDEIDAGPVYMKRPMSLSGLAEEIYTRSADIISGMIQEIVTKNPEAIEQTGDVSIFKRRKPEQSEISVSADSFEKLFDHIRMLDATGYPRAFLQHGPFRYEFSRPALRSGSIHADVIITRINSEDEND